MLQGPLYHDSVFIGLSTQHKTTNFELRNCQDSEENSKVIAENEEKSI